MSLNFCEIFTNPDQLKDNDKLVFQIDIFYMSNIQSFLGFLFALRKSRKINSKEQYLKCLNDIGHCFL